jgi:Amt family ammonium transporter
VGDRGLIGNATDFLFLEGLDNSYALIGTIPAAVFIAFQGLFAAITVALISGSIADRAKFGAWMIFAGIWATLVYFPVAHWVFAFDDFVATTGGWIANDLGAIDFAGGTAVHINAGAAGLALALILGKRVGFGRVPMRPHSLPLVMLGAALLWVGWFGFNAGSAVASNGTAGLALLNTLAATTAAVLSWLLVEKIRDGHATSLGAASGVVAGLVAITPACAAVNASGALIIGVVAGALCALSVGLKFKFGYDDSLDVVAVHLVGGLVGTIMVGFVGVEVGLFNGGGTDQLVSQVIGAAAVLGYSFVATLIIGKIIDLIFGFRITQDEELEGIDLAVHAERAYEIFDNNQGSTFGSSKGGQS